MIRSVSDFLRLASADPFVGQPVGAAIVRFVTVLVTKGRMLSPQIPLNLPPAGRWC